MLNLDKYQNTAHQVKKGVSEKYILVTESDVLYFKKNISNNYGVILPNDVLEVFVSYILEHTGCKNFVKYDFATLNGERGCVSKSFLSGVKYEISLLDAMELLYANKVQNSVLDIDTKFDNEFFSQFYNFAVENEMNRGGSTFTIDSICEKMEEFAQYYRVRFDKKKTANRLREIATYDYFLGNGDRTWTNLEFLVTKDELKLAPIFDNGMSFGIWHFENDGKAPVFSHLGFTAIDDEENLEQNNLLKDGGLIVLDIMREAKNDKRVAKLVEIFKNLDFSKMLAKFKAENNIEIDEDVENYITQIYEMRVKLFKQKENKVNKIVNRHTPEEQKMQ